VCVLMFLCISRVCQQGRHLSIGHRISDMWPRTVVAFIFVYLSLWLASTIYFYTYTVIYKIMYGVYIRYLRQGIHQIYGHIRSYTVSIYGSGQPYLLSLAEDDNFSFPDAASTLGCALR